MRNERSALYLPDPPDPRSADVLSDPFRSVDSVVMISSFLFFFFRGYLIRVYSRNSRVKGQPRITRISRMPTRLCATLRRTLRDFAVRKPSAIPNPAQKKEAACRWRLPCSAGYELPVSGWTLVSLFASSVPQTRTSMVVHIRFGNNTIGLFPTRGHRGDLRSCSTNPLRAGVALRHPFVP